MASGLLDGLAQRLLAESAYRFSIADGSADWSTAFRIRATASIEAGWAWPDAFPDGMERDEFDDAAVHVLGWDGGDPICTGRLVFPPGPLPTEVACGLVVEPQGQVVDVGRMAVLRSHQTFGHGAFLVLLCRLYCEARAAGFEFACGVMAAPARSLVDRLGLRLEQLGPDRVERPAAGGPLGRGRSGRRAQHQRGVDAAESKRIRQPVACLDGSGPACDDVQVEVRVHSPGAGNRRHDPRSQRVQRHDGLDRAGAADHVPGRTLHGRHGRDTPGEERRELTEFRSSTATSISPHRRHARGRQVAGSSSVSTVGSMEPTASPGV
jgi:GNAT superfamily N-acetyltransferase